MTHVYTINEFVGKVDDFMKSNLTKELYEKTINDMNSAGISTHNDLNMFFLEHNLYFYNVDTDVYRKPNGICGFEAVLVKDNIGYRKYWTLIGHVLTQDRRISDNINENDVSELTKTIEQPTDTIITKVKESSCYLTNNNDSIVSVTGTLNKHRIKYQDLPELHGDGYVNDVMSDDTASSNFQKGYKIATEIHGKLTEIKRQLLFVDFDYEYNIYIKADIDGWSINCLSETYHPFVKHESTRNEIHINAEKAYEAAEKMIRNFKSIDWR